MKTMCFGDVMRDDMVRAGLLGYLLKRLFIAISMTDILKVVEMVPFTVMWFNIQLKSLYLKSKMAAKCKMVFTFHKSMPFSLISL